MDREEVEGQVLRARRMLKRGEHRGHGAVEVVGVEGHDYVNGGRGRGAAVLASRSLPKERKLQGKTTDNNNLTVLINFNGRNLLEIK